MHRRRWADAGAASLVEREEELAVIEAVLASSRSGVGSVLLIEGPPGIGKSSLLSVARDRAAEMGMRVLCARGTEFEREYPLGVARQCLEPALRRERDRERLLRGPARLAGPLLLDVLETKETTSVGILHGLYWLVASLADEGPVLLAVDDAHWADEPSLRFLAYLARRVEELPVALVIGARGEHEARGGSAAAIVELRADPTIRRMEPPPLAVAGVQRLLGEGECGIADETFARACQHAAGGNPFLLGELARALRGDGVPFTAEGADRVTEVTPPTVTRTVAETLTRLGPRAIALGAWVANGAFPGIGPFRGVK